MIPKIYAKQLSFRQGVSEAGEGVYNKYMTEADAAYNAAENPIAKRIAILLSGNGSNLQAIIEAIDTKKLVAQIVVVVSNKLDAYGLIRAQKAGIPTQVLLSTSYATREQYDEALKTLLLSYAPDLIVFSGFMRIVSTVFVEAFEGRILNLHPSLLPKYPGLNTYQRAIEAGDKEHGSTVHVVTAELDAGPIVLQRKVSVLPDDTPETLKQRTQQMEYQLYPEAIAYFFKTLNKENKLC